MNHVGWVGSFNWGNGAAWEQDFKRPDKGGTANSWVDTADFVYFTGEFGGGPDLLTREYHVEVELRDPRAKGKESIQGPRRVIRLPAYR